MTVKLTQEIAEEIRRRYSAGGITQKQLADLHGVAQTKISDIIRMKTWVGKSIGVKKGHKFGPQSAEHVAKRFAAGAGAQKGIKQSPEHVEKCRQTRIGKKINVRDRAGQVRKQWGDGVYDGLFNRQAKFAYNGIGMRSNWERMAAAKFDEHGIRWEYEPRRFRLPTGQYYYPDFHLTDIDLWVEVKGYATFNALAKFDMFVGLGHDAVLVTGQNEDEFLKEVEELIGDVTVTDATSTNP